MAGNESSLVVSDAGPVIHLDEIGCLDLLNDFETVLVPTQVWAEIQRHRPGLLPDAIPGLRIVRVDQSPSPGLQALARSLSLDQGEFAALILMQTMSAQLFLCDDSAARLAAESLRYQVHGTIGIVIRAIRRGQRSQQQVLALLTELPQRSSLHIARDLLRRIIDTANQAHQGSES